MARQLLVLQVLVVLVLVALAMGFTAYEANRVTREDAAHRVTAVATTFATSPSLLSALRTKTPSTTIEPMAEAVRRASGVDFVTVMSMRRIRYSHPNPREIGRPFLGDVGGAPEGHVFTEQYVGTLGLSMRTVAPIKDARGRVVAMVAVGITIAAIDRQLTVALVAIGVAASVVLGIGLAGAWLVSRRVRRQTHGLTPRELTRMYEFYSAVLSAMREGLVLLDQEGRVQLANSEAHHLLDLPPDVVGRHFSDLGLPPGLVQAALGTTASSDDLYVAGERLLLVSSSPATWSGRDVGAVVTLRDQTELRAATGELEVVRGLTDSLRSLHHETGNRLHTIVSLIELERYPEALAFATDELGLAQSLTDQLVGAVGDTALTALLVGKSAQAAERGIHLEVSGDVSTHDPTSSRDLVTVVGNLIDNAFDALTNAPNRRVEVAFSGDGGTTSITVRDSGPGLSREQADLALTRGWSTKAEPGHGLGLALVNDVVRRHDGTITITRSELGGAEFRVTMGGSR